MDFTRIFLQMLLALVVVCGAAVFILRYWVPRLSGFRGRKKNNSMTMISRIGLAPGAALYLVKIGKRYFALGGGEGGLSVITEMTEEEADQGEKHG